jgi:aromatic-L-amino-acid decarboxylase
MKVSTDIAHPLDLSADEFKAMMVEVVQLLSTFLTDLPNAPFFDRSGLQDFLKDPQVRTPPSERGRTLHELLMILQRGIVNDGNTASGRALVGIPATGLVSSAIADLISGVFNRFTAFGFASPAMVTLESDILRWLMDLAGLPATAGGLLTSGASMATFSALLCARSARLPENFSKGVIYASDQAHHCIGKAVRLSGFPRAALHTIPTDHAQHMDVDALRHAITRDRAAGLVPFCVVANGGSTDTGSIDPLPALAALAREEGLWFHVDAAYGGFFLLTARGRERLKGLECADSVVMDPHKGLFLPLGTGCLLVRDASTLQRAHSGEMGPYARDLDKFGVGVPQLPDFSSLSPELTRPFRGLRLWLPLHLHGVAAFRAALDEKLDLAEQLYSALRGMSDIRLIGPPELSIVAFSCRLPDGSQQDEDNATEDLIRKINEPLRFQLATSKIQGRVIIRVPLMSPRTTAATVLELLNSIEFHRIATA